MRKQVKSQNKHKRKRVLSSSVDRILKNQKYAGADTALELVEVYEAVERTYRAALMAGETYARVAYSTNY
jgi:hypothetical protein